MSKTANQKDGTLDIGLQPLSHDDPTPLYHQLYTALKDRIQSGDIPSGSKIPSELQLAEHLDISRITAKRALNELAQSGLVTRQRGRGTIVTANTDLNFSDRKNDYIKNVTKLRETTRAEILSREIINAPTSVAKNLGLAENTAVEKITHRLSLRGETLSYVETYLPQNLAAKITKAQLVKKPIVSLLMDAGVSVTRAEQDIFAVSASDEMAEILGATSGRPLLTIHCIMYDADSRAVQDIYAWYHPDRYSYHMTLTNLAGEADL